MIGPVIFGGAPFIHPPLVLVYNITVQFVESRLVVTNILEMTIMVVVTLRISIYLFVRVVPLRVLEGRPRPRAGEGYGGWVWTGTRGPSH